MKIRYGGQYVFIEDDWEKVRSLKCSCGHQLIDHYFHNLEGEPNVIEVGACKISNHCGQFRIIKARNRNYSYA